MPSRKRHKPSSPTPPPIWLDLFPQDITVRIISHLLSGKGLNPHPDLRNLAQTSETQRNAVIACLNSTFDLRVHGMRTELPLHYRTWQQIFRNDVKELHTKVDYLAVDNYAFESPSLHHITIPITHPWLKHILSPSIKSDRIPSLDSLHLILRDWISLPLRTMYVALKSMPKLTRLQLTCTTVPVQCCLLAALFARKFEQKYGWSSAYLFDSITLPNLVDVDLRCRYHHCNKIEPWLRVIGSASTLTTNFSIPSRADTKLRKLQSLNLVNPPNVFRTALRVGAPVTSIDMSTRKGKQRQDPLAAAQVAQLIELPRLSSLNIFLERGAEASLQKAGHQLRRVNLDWPNRTPPQKEQRMCILNEQDNIILLLRDAPFIEELVLHNMSITCSGLKEILMTVGERLKVFGMTFPGHGDAPQDLILSLCSFLMVYNTSLQGADFRLQSECGVPILRKQEWLPRMMRAIGMLARRFPLVNFSELKSVAYLLTMCYT